MATIDQVEQLRTRAHVSYQDAKDALEACDDDILEAMIYLEKQGKVSPPNLGGAYSTQRPYSPPPKYDHAKNDSESISSLITRFFNWVGVWLRKSNRNFFTVTRNNEEILTIRIILLLVLMIFLFEASFVILGIGLLAGFRFHFHGPDIDKPFQKNTQEDPHE